MPHSYQHLVFLKHRVLSLLQFSSLLHALGQTYSVLAYSCTRICFFLPASLSSAQWKKKIVKIQVEIFSRERCCQLHDHIMAKSLFSSISSSTTVGIKLQKISTFRFTGTPHFHAPFHRLYWHVLSQNAPALERHHNFINTYCLFRLVVARKAMVREA